MRSTYHIMMRAWLSLLISALISTSLVLSLHEPAQAQTQDYCYHTPRDVGIPLNDLGNRVYIRMDGQNTGFTGGLYPGGSNLRPPGHELAGLALARQIVPRDRDGQPDPNGKIVMVAIGMSNAYLEFSAFIDQARADPGLNPAIVLVNGAQPGRTAEQWIDPNSTTWTTVNMFLAQNNVTSQQVQVAWVKNTLTGSGPFPGKTQDLQQDLEQIIRNLKSLYPNTEIAYISSRTNSYIYWSGLSPEPNAYETGFAVKWMIEKQINGDPTLNYNPARGPVVAPFLSWGPYIWANGPTPRSDGLAWLNTDMIVDCTHPSSNGEAKVSQMLMDFFKNDSTTTWFRSVGPAEWRTFLPLIFNFGLPN